MNIQDSHSFYEALQEALMSLRTYFISLALLTGQNNNTIVAHIKVKTTLRQLYFCFCHINRCHYLQAWVQRLNDQVVLHRALINHCDKAFCAGRFPR